MTDAFWSDRPVFVTGATGLVGGWLVKRLLAQMRQCHYDCASADRLPTCITQLSN